MPGTRSQWREARRIVLVVVVVVVAGERGRILGGKGIRGGSIGGSSRTNDC